MTDRLTIACVQANPVMGDLAHNLALARRARADAAAGGADLVLFSELFVCGYPPEDLVLRPNFVRACRGAVEDLARETQDGGPAVLVGTPWPEGGKVFNAVCLLQEGEVASVRHKVNLPSHGPFGEARVFAEGELPGPIRFRDIGLGVPICEDIWIDEIVECLEETGAELLLVPNGSPWWRGKHDLRLNVAVARVTESGLPLLYVNQVGGQDELAFDGGSFGLNGDRSLACQMPAFESGLAITRWQRDGGGWRCIEAPVTPLPDEDGLIWLACVTGLRDYAGKNGFTGVVIDRSGGLDSAVCEAMAVDALGAGCVRCDARPIATSGSPTTDVGNTLLLTPCSKSDWWIGHGLANDGFNPIKDIYGSELRRCAEWRNRNRPVPCMGPEGEVFPQAIIAGPPRAEPGPYRGGIDVLPPYETLDDILRGLIEHDLSVQEIAERGGHPPETVRKVEDMVLRAEYKRRQSAPGVKISARNLGRDRRYPITNRFRDPAGAWEE